MNPDKSFKNFKICPGRTGFRKITPNLTITIGDFESNFEVLEKKIKKPLKVPSLARSVPKPLKVPSLARSVRKPLSIFGRSWRAPDESLTSLSTPYQLVVDAWGSP